MERRGPGYSPFSLYPVTPPSVCETQCFGFVSFILPVIFFPLSRYTYWVLHFILWSPPNWIFYVFGGIGDSFVLFFSFWDNRRYSIASIDCLFFSYFGWSLFKKVFYNVFLWYFYGITQEAKKSYKSWCKHKVVSDMKRSKEMIMEKRTFRAGRVGMGGTRYFLGILNSSSILK